LIRGLFSGDGGRRSPEAKPRIVAKREPRPRAGRGLGNPQVGVEGLCYEGSASQTCGAAVNRPADLTDEMIAKKILELAKAGERNVEVSCEAALKVPMGAVSAPNPPPLPASPPEPPGSSS